MVTYCIRIHVQCTVQYCTGRDTVVYNVHAIYLTAILPSFSEDGSCHFHLCHLSVDGSAAIAIFAIFQKMKNGNGNVIFTKITVEMTFWAMTERWHVNPGNRGSVQYTVPWYLLIQP